MTPDATVERTASAVDDKSTRPGASAAPLLAAVLLGGLAVRAAYASARHLCFGDESCYLWLAQNLSSGAGYTYYNGTPELHFPPLFPVALGVLNWIVRDWEAVSRVAYVLLGSLLPLPVFLLGKDMYGRRVGLIASLLTAVLPAFTTGILFAETLSEPLYLLCLFTGIYFVFKASVSRAYRHFTLAGVMLSLAYLTRSEGQLYFAVGIIFLAGVLRFYRSLPLAEATLRLLACAAAFLLVASPYVIYLHSHTGHWALDTKTTTSYTTTRGLVHHDGEAFQRDTWGLSEKGEVKYYAHEVGESLPELLLGKYRDRIIPDVRANLGNAWNALQRPWVCGRWFLALALLGFTGAIAGRRRYSTEVLNLMVAGSLASVLVFFITERFLYGLLLPILLWSACGLDLLLQAIEKAPVPASRSFRVACRGLQAVILAGIVGYLGLAGWRHFETKTPQQDEAWAAASWLKANTPPGAVVMSTGPEVAFHAGRRWLPAPVASRAEVVAYGRKRGATHLCIRGRYLRVRPDQKRELYDGAGDFDDLELLVRSGGKPSDPSFVVYRLKPPPN